MLRVEKTPMGSPDDILFSRLRLLHLAIRAGPDMLRW